MFHIGQKVVFIGDIIPRPFGDENIPVKGSIYIVRGLQAGGNDRIGLLLCEIDNSHMIERWGWGVEPALSSHLFRPVIDRQTDISIFTEMLTPEAEAKAAREAQEAADSAAMALRKADQEQREATARALKAERDFAAAAAKAEQDKKDAAAKAERDRRAAIETERRRVADAKASEAAEIARREADKAHRKTINSEALAALVAAGLTIEQGVIAITAIVKCAVPHIRISY